jgi:hypothetical protein
MLIRFVTEAMSILVNEGETVRLPCVVDRLEGFVLLWKQKVGIEGKGFDSYWLPYVSWTGWRDSSFSGNRR